MTIEIATQASDELILALRHLLPQLNPNIQPPSQTELKTMLDSDATTFFIARDQQGIIRGTLALIIYRVPTGVHALIEDVVVDESARNQGIGKELTCAALLAARAKGAGSVSLTSRPQREAANHLYQRLGFRLRATNPYFYDLSEMEQ